MDQITDRGEDWSAFELKDLLAQRNESAKLYLPFLRVSSLHAGIYVLPAGGEDPQRPHEEDEMYFIIRGRGKFQVQEDEISIRPGSVLYVRAGVSHRFRDIEEELEILVFFSTAKK